MADRVSMRSIAKMAGFSHMTVSLALRNHPSLPEETRQRILAIADKMGYRPDPLISKVMSGLRDTKNSGRMLAFVTRFGSFQWKNSPVYHSVYQGMHQAALQYGYGLETFALGNMGFSAKRLRLILETRAINGIVFGSDPLRIGHNPMNVEGFSCIQLGSAVLRPQIHRITNHHAHTLMTALRKLRHFGNRRIALVMHGLIDRRNEYAWSAYYHTFQQTIRPAERIPLLKLMENDESKSNDFGRFKKWFEKHRPDAIACLEAELPSWLEQLGVRVPDEVQIAVLDWNPQLAHCAGIDQSHFLVGQTAIELLLGQIYIHDTGVPAVPRTTLIEGVWVNGPSAIARTHRKS